MKKILGSLLLVTISVVAQEQPKISGFTAESSAREAAIEKQFFALPSPENIRKVHRWLTA